MRLPDSFLDEVRARTPMAVLVGRRVKLARSGRQWKGCCPFHGEKTPSFYVYDDGYHCFGCGAHGDAIGFVMQAQGASFMEAVEQLAGEAGLEVPKPSESAVVAERVRLDLHAILQHACEFYQRTLATPAGAAGLAYLRGRGLSDATIKRFGLGWSGDGRGALTQALAGDDVSPARLMEAGLLRPGEDGSPRGELFYNRVMFPIRDRRGRVISFGGRMLGDGQPKYVNGPESPVFSKRRTLYGLDLAREAVRGGAPVVVVEGYMDVITLHQAGFAGAVAPLGTALTAEQLELLWQLSPSPILCFDGDAAGGRAADRAIEVALPQLATDRTIRIALLPPGDDPDTLIRGQGPAGFGAVLEAARPLAESLFEQTLREVGATTTPEKRDELFKKLKGRAALIGDRGLAGEYAKDLMERCNRHLGRGRTPFKPGGFGFKRGAPGMPPPPRFVRPARDAVVTTEMAEGVRNLTAVLVRHPALLIRLEDAYQLLPLPAAAQALFEAMQAYEHTAESLDFDGLIAHLRSLRLTDELAWVLGGAPYPLQPYAGADVTAADAEAGWWQQYRLMRSSSLKAEIDAVGRDYQATFDEAARQRFLALRAELERVQGAVDGSDSLDGADEEGAG